MCEFFRIEEPINVIALDQVGAEHFGEASLRQPPAHLELEQSILRLRVAERAREVEPVLRVDMRDAGGVANHLDRRAQSGEFDDARLRRESAKGRAIQSPVITVTKMNATTSPTTARRRARGER